LYLTPASALNGLRPGPASWGRAFVLLALVYSQPCGLARRVGEPLSGGAPRGVGAPPVFPLGGERLRTPCSCLRPDLTVWQATRTIHLQPRPFEIVPLPA